MSEILFRGKSTETGAWIYGIPLAEGMNSSLKDNMDMYCWVGSLHNYDSEEVLTKTIGMYTNLSDTNSVKIFVGDIVDLFGSRGEIVYECGAFGISFKPYVNWSLIEARISIVTGRRLNPQFCINDSFISLWELYWNFEQENDRLDILEIVGNVHENPELLGN